MVPDDFHKLLNLLIMSPFASFRISYHIILHNLQFELKEKGLTSVVSAVIGKRSIDDFNDITKVSKVRFSREQMITEIK